MLKYNDLLFFLSCNPQREEIDKFNDDKEIVSIYQVCGRNPWLIVYKPSSIENIFGLNQKYQLNIQHLSIAFPQNLAETNSLSGSNKQISWIFIKGENLSDRDHFKKSFLKRYQDFEIAQVYQIFGGEYNFILKLHTSDIGDVDRFLIRCHKENISTSTKCVLTELKDENRLCERDIEKKKIEAAEIKRGLPYAIARIMANTRGFIQKSKEEQKRCLKDKLTSMGIPIGGQIERFLLDPELDKNEYSKRDLDHPNDLIDRYSIKLERGGWLKVLFFLGLQKNPNWRRL